MKYYLGLDLGGTNMAAAVVDEDYNIVAKAIRPTLAKREADEIIKDMYDVSVEAANKVDMTLEDFTSWGIGMPSCLNQKQFIVNANNFAWVNFPIFDYLRKYTKIPIHISNDANCAALGETIAGAAKKYDNTLVITIGTGIGSGIVLNNKIFSGSDGMGAEFGHTKLVYGGLRCSCGKRGCVESYCSATALIRQMREVLIEDKNSLVWKMCGGDLDKINGKMICDAAREKDYLAHRIMDQFIDYLSYALASYIAIFRPDAIVIGGGIADAGDVLFKQLEERLLINTFAANQIGNPPVIPAKLGNKAGIIGAAMLERYNGGKL